MKTEADIAAGPTVTRIKRLRPRPGDVLVLRSNKLSTERFRALRKGLFEGGVTGVVLVCLALDEDINRLDEDSSRVLYDTLKKQFEPGLVDDGR